MRRALSSTALVAVVLSLVVLPEVDTVSAAGEQGASSALSGSLPRVTTGVRPGPDVLYQPAPAAPQLENRSPRFRAEPLLVSGHEAYQDGEYLYQDHLYDDYGSDTDGAGATGLSPRVGDIEYPADRDRYGGNAADLVEFRVAVTPTDVAYRFTLNTLLEPDTTIIALAWDTDRDEGTGQPTLPRDPGAPFPGTDQVLEVWGVGAEHHVLSADSQVSTALGVDTDLEANQITVVVPRSVSDPQGTWRATLAVGLYDAAGDTWFRPRPSSSAGDNQGEAPDGPPTGAGTQDPDPAGIFNLGFRFEEPYLTRNVPPDTAQAVAIRQKRPTTFARDIDFDALDAGIDRSTVPASGTQVRFFPSRLDRGEGRDLDRFPAYLGQLQPYSLYVPSTVGPGSPAGLTVNSHSLGAHHWQYNGSLGTLQLGEQRGNLVATAMARGPDGWYQEEGEYDVFEMWNDVAAHFSLDPDRTAATGYSMGGYATYRLAGLYPDLFGAAFTTVGPPGEGIWLPPAPPTGSGRGTLVQTDGPKPQTLSNLWLENVRNVPFFNAVAAEDELVPLPGPRAQNLGAPELGIRGLDQLGYRFRFLVYSPAEHFTLALRSYDIPQAAEYLGDARVDRDPYHVTFARVPGADAPDFGLIHDHAYWVSEVEVAASDGPDAKGVVDAFSHGAGLGDPPSVPGRTAGNVPLPYAETNRSWGEPPPIPVENRLDVTLDNISAARLDLARARLSAERELRVDVKADGPGTLTLDGSFPEGSQVQLRGAAVGVAGPTGAELPVEEGQSTYTVVVPEGAERLAGVGRVDTAVAVSQRGFPDGATTALLARADQFPDALAAAPLATEVGGPVLLTPSNELAPAVAAELERLGVDQVVLLGGEAALSTGVAHALGDYQVRRLAGVDRFETAAAVARDLVAQSGSKATQAIVVRGDAFPDALAAGNLATVARAPVLLTRSDQLPQVTRDALAEVMEGERVFVAGGASAVSDAVLGQLTAGGQTPLRLAGQDRYATAAAILDEAIAQGADPEPVLLASGADFPDALAAAPLARTLGGVLVLADPRDLTMSSPTRDFLTGRRGEISTILVVGGTTAVSPQVVLQVRDAIAD